jgi:fucose 4-O-acetylase-like acetyltransferase
MKQEIMKQELETQETVKQEIMNKEMTKKNNQLNSFTTKDIVRDYLFDNLKAILIILVVWGHILTSMKEEHVIIKSIYIFLFFFHMPAMVFISGYFSKKLEKIRNNAFVTILIPYLILNSVNYVFKIFILKEEFYAFRFFNPNWGLWYLLTLFLWKFFLKDFIKIRLLLPLSLIVALVSGFSNEFSEYMALGRFVCFLPFFLAGYYCTGEHVARIRRFPKQYSVFLFVSAVIWSLYTATKDIFDTEILFLRSYYPMGEEIKTMLFRLIVYVVAFGMIFVLLNLVTTGKTLLTGIGASTITVYVLHIFTIPLLEKMKLFANQPINYLIYSVLMTALITYIYSRPIVKRVYNVGMDKLTGLFIKKEKL